MNHTEHRRVQLPTRWYVVSSTKWPIMDFGSIDFENVTYCLPGTTAGRVGLMSHVQRHSVIQQNDHKKCDFHAWLWCEYEWDERDHHSPTGV